MRSPSQWPLRPGATIGILGNGQLGRMLCLAAARLGYRTHVFGPDKDSPAEQVATKSTVAAYEDTVALGKFADAIDVVTFEFENVPVKAAAFLTERVTVRPSWRALEIAQDRIKEKTFFASIGASTAPWRPINSERDIKIAIADIQPPAILKTNRMGYDGKGQTKIISAADAEGAWIAIGGTTEATRPYAVLEGFVDFTREISVIAARGADGTTVCFEPTENVHANHMLSTSTVPALISPTAASAAADIAMRAVQALDLVGLLALEMFVTQEGTLLCNEMAPRPHNSGHWTMDGGGCDQFEMLVRAAAGLPLVAPARTVDVTMINLVGEDVNDLGKYQTDPNARIHLYGKTEARAGRKMGHVNIVKPRK